MAISSARLKKREERKRRIKEERELGMRGGRGLKLGRSDVEELANREIGKKGHPTLGTNKPIAQPKKRDRDIQLPSPNTSLQNSELKEKNSTHTDKDTHTVTAADVLPARRKFGGSQPNAGRKKAQHTIASEAFKKYIINEVVKKKSPIVKALIDKAMAGDVKAADLLLERVLGRPVTPLDHGGEGLQELTNAIGNLLSPKKKETK